MQDRLELTSPPNAQNNFRSNNLKKPTRAEFLIHSLKTLDDLLAEKRLKNEKPDLRFIVDTAGKAWFARETHAGAAPTPAHYEMTGNKQNQAYCKTAGNIQFTDATSTVLKKINNKSGDFRPSFKSLKWILAILILNEENLPFQLPEILLVEEQGESNGHIIGTYEVPMAMIKGWVEAQVTDLELVRMLSKQTDQTKTVSYKPLARSFENRRDESPTRNSQVPRSLFGLFSAAPEQDTPDLGITPLQLDNTTLATDDEHESVGKVLFS